MASIESAYQIGAKIIEFDVHHTSDKEPILMHDSTLKKTATHRAGATCPLRTKISDLTWEEIQSQCILKNGEEIPHLLDVFERYHQLNVRFFFELKDKPSRTTMEIIERYYSDHPERLTFISFKKSALKKIVESSIVGPIVEGGAKVLHLASSSLFAKKCYDGVGLSKPSIRTVNRLMNRGLEVAAFTINDSHKMMDYIDTGLTYLISDDPATCIELNQNTSRINQQLAKN